MPTALHSYIIDSDGVIRVRVTVFADTEDSAEYWMNEHEEKCQDLAEHKTIEIYEEIPALPDREALQAVAEAQSTEEDDEDVDEEEPEGDEELDEEEQKA
jgi:hypothetical protein